MLFNLQNVVNPLPPLVLARQMVNKKIMTQI